MKKFSLRRGTNMPPPPPPPAPPPRPAQVTSTRVSSIAAQAFGRQEARTRDPNLRVDFVAQNVASVGERAPDLMRLLQRDVHTGPYPKLLGQPPAGMNALQYADQWNRAVRALHHQSSMIGAPFDREQIFSEYDDKYLLALYGTLPVGSSVILRFLHTTDHVQAARVRVESRGMPFRLAPPMRLSRMPLSPSAVSDRERFTTIEITADTLVFV